MKKLAIMTMVAALSLPVASGAFAQGQKIKPLTVQKSTQDSLLGLGAGSLGGAGAGIALGLLVLVVVAAAGNSTSGT